MVPLRPCRLGGAGRRGTIQYRTCGPRARLSHRRRPQHQQLPARGPGSRASVAALGNRARILVAFPAGNGGAGLWFAKTQRNFTWTLVRRPNRSRASTKSAGHCTASNSRSRQMRANCVRLPRFFRRCACCVTTNCNAKRPPKSWWPRASRRVDSWERDRLDGEADSGSRSSRRGTRASAERLWLQRRAAAPAGAGADRRDSARAARLTAHAQRQRRRARPQRARIPELSRQIPGRLVALRYLFGRDTLISALLLAPVLEPQAMESAIASVLFRLAPNGEVAHEEDIGEFAVLRNAREGRGRMATPVYDYGMVDDDFLLAPLAARWLLSEGGRAQAARFLGGEARVANGTAPNWRAISRGSSSAQNHLPMIRAPPILSRSSQGARPANGVTANRAWGGGATPMTSMPRWCRLRSMQLRCSRKWTARRLHRRGPGAPVDACPRECTSVGGTRTGFFAVEIPARRAREAIAAYAGEIGVGFEPALRALGDTPLAFHALSLDERAADPDPAFG